MIAPHFPSAPCLSSLLAGCAVACATAFVGTGLATTQSAGARTHTAARPATPWFSDDFEDGQIASKWKFENAGLAQFTETNGALVITPVASGPNAIWYNDTEGPLVYQRVFGDFTVRATLHARDTVVPSAPPPQPYRLGGLLVRNPNSTSPDLDWVHVAIGGGDASFPVAVEDKTTVDSSSDFVFQSIPTPDAELRIRRRGTSFELAWRPIGAQTWTPLRTHQRPDLPVMLDVGLMAYSASTPPRLALTVDAIVFEP
ncbi:MAG: hypothetical protein L6Q99_13885 [Planctomycetes bacterium]|nr:hypothetical protein [Planctomycetota bacterium]